MTLKSLCHESLKLRNTQFQDAGKRLPVKLFIDVYFLEAQNQDSQENTIGLSTAIFFSIFTVSQTNFRPSVSAGGARIVLLLALPGYGDGKLDVLSAGNSANFVGYHYK